MLLARKVAVREFPDNALVGVVSLLSAIFCMKWLLLILYGQKTAGREPIIAEVIITFGCNWLNLLFRKVKRET